MGGIPITIALSLNTGIPVVFVRKEAKVYDTCKLAKRIDIQNKNKMLLQLVDKLN